MTSEIAGPAPAKVHFGGLDALRFFAALFVVIGHIPLNQASGQLPSPAYGALFFRGAPAVAFFFTLSGFLITYLLLAEQERTGTIGVRKFYLRRVLRIWPLYFAVVAFGLAFYNLALPALGIAYPVAYSVPLAALLYLFFLPNLMNSLYTVGGILNPLWSIGIEEQFYLGWAPAVRRWHARLPRLLAVVFSISLAIFVLNQLEVFGPFRAKMFFGQLKFHFMAIGGFAAWALVNQRERLLGAWPFASRIAQWILLALLADYYLFNWMHWGGYAEELAQLALYPWMIVNVAANPRRILSLRGRSPAARTLDHLGVISYGIYMLHMIAVYATTALFQRTSWWHGRPLALYCVAYYGIAIGSTLALAHLSYRFFESPFLRLKNAKFSVVESGPAT
ncbi:MAG TPA: acyltransferase [Thermoanaerobaculia bacterium]|nr:acyltransferase [Thermoanaerobaculia bacterium]